MKRRPHTGGMAAQRGIVALELALILMCALAVLPAMLLMGRVFWHYTVLEKSVHDAARYMASLPPAEMINPAKAYAAAGTAQAMVVAAASAAQLNPAPQAWQVMVACDGYSCGSVSTLPLNIRVTAELSLDDELLGTLSYNLLNTTGFILNADITQRYGD
jgi:hypothetical protein